MSLTETQQLQEMIKRSERPLIVLPAHASVDHFSAAFGVREALKKMDKEAVIVSEAEAPKQLAGIQTEEAHHKHIPRLHDLTIELDLAAAEMESVRHEVVGNKLHIHVTPKSGMWKNEHVSVQPSQFRYDLVICLGVQDLASCGAPFRDNPDFFFHTPILNIDHSPANEHFGQVNFVNVTAAAIGEVCHEILSVIDKGLMDAKIATHFLTGMIAKTKSFKTRNVTPKTLSVASQLLEAGARREDIIHHLYRTRSVATLRLWGRALARLKSDQTRKIVWSLLSAQDFLHAGANEDDLPEVIDELIAMSPEAETVILLYENHEHHVCGIIRAHTPAHAVKPLASFGATGTAEEARICLHDVNLVEAERQILEAMQR